MNVRILGEHDRLAYETALETFPLGDYAQAWSWGELKRLSGWEPIRLAISDRRETRLVATLLLRRLPLPYVDWHILYCPRGPACDPQDWDAMQRFFVLLADLGEERRAILAKIDPDIPDAPEVRAQLSSFGLVPGRLRGPFEGFQPRHVARLSLSGTPAETFQSFHPKGRYNVRLAYRHGVRVVAGEAQDVAAFYALLTDTAHRQRFFVREFAYVKAVYDAFVPSNRGILLLAHREGRLLAGALVAASGRKASYLLGASARYGREHMPAYLVQWEAIHWAHRQGCTVYDFLGVGPPGRRSALDGLWAFKSKFGARRVSFIGEWDLPINPAAHALWRTFEGPLTKGRALVARAHLGRAPLPQAVRP